MSPERWQQVKSVLARAIEQPNEQARADFLATACVDDTALRREVFSLLDQPTDEFDSCAARIGLMSDEPVLDEHTGRRLGAYELIRELGRGGMGAVWLARRADQQFEKLVAIKLLKRGTDTDEVLRRFHAERQILARLDHPNISRLLDAGTTDDGLPYFVMEYVEGARLNDFVFAQNLSLGDRLRLFRKICGAVQFAHQNLVVHRDLKPGNILVTPEGEPKLLDFGVAKLLAPDEEAWEQTLVGRERFTPGYASPEQIRGEPITTVSDVYSLGAILYETLTDTPPHRFATKTPTAPQIASVICDEPPIRPSAAARDPEMRRQLRGDLDTIVLRALAKAPERRYRGAGNLADDLQRYLENRPVRARPDTFAYRAGKFLRRNRTGAAAAALVLLSLIAGVIATARQAQIANRERARAERRFNEVRKIANSFMFEFHNLIADLPGALTARQLVTRRAMEYLDSLAQEAGDDPSLKSELALAYNKIGNLTFDLPQAIALREKAVSLGEALVEAAPRKTAHRLQLSESYDQLSDVMKIAGHSQPAIEYARKSLAMIQSVHEQDLPPRSLKAALGDCHLGLAIAFSNAGDFRQAMQHARAALQIQERLAAEDPANKETRRKLEANYAAVGDALADAGDFKQAIAEANKGLAIAEEILASEPANSRYRRDMWATHFRLGRYLAANGDPANALDHYRRGLEFLEALAAADPNDIGHRRWLAVTYSAIGDAQAALGDQTEALAFQKKAMVLSEKLAQEDPERVEVQQDVVKISLATGASWLAQNQPAGAAPYFERAISLGEKLLRDDPENARVRSALARADDGLAECDRRLAKKSASKDAELQLRTAEQLQAQSRQLRQELKESGKFSAIDAAAAH